MDVSVGPFAEFSNDTAGLKDSLSKHLHLAPPWVTTTAAAAAASTIASSKCALYLLTYLLAYYYYCSAVLLSMYSLL